VGWQPEGTYRELTAAEEVALGRAIRDAEGRLLGVLDGVECVRSILGRVTSGRYRTRAGLVDKLDEAVRTLVARSAEDATLVRVARAAEAAWDEADVLRWKLAMSQQRIAFHEARKVGGRFMDRTDLTQEGYLGLLRAAKRFDPERGLRFSTYARWWVRAQITRAIDQSGRVVRLPGAAVEQLRNLRKAILDHERAGTPWTVGVVAQEIGIDRERAEFLLSRGEAVSLGDATPDDDDHGRPLAGTLADAEAVDPLAEVIRTQEAIRARTALAEELDERQQRVVTSRYGLDGEEPQSLTDVGRQLALSRERVRQLEKEALSRLRDEGDIRETA
jgi:RNA polymerase sigma factor (sigma-70 family)